MGASGKSAVRIDGVRLTSPDRVLFAGQGITKRELAEFYRGIAEWVLPHLEGRPLTLVRCPRGQGQQCFVQRRAGEGFPEEVGRVEIPEDDGTATYGVVEDLPGLLALVQLGVLELHTWGARGDRLDRPDRLILDLDPGPGVSWAEVAEGARDVRDVLAEAGLRSWVKTSGGKGLHVVAPLLRRQGWDEVRHFARALAERMERERPDRYVAAAAKAERGGRIYVDYLRNGWSASAVAAYSTRAREGAPVSTPLAWEELDDPPLPETLNVRTLPARLAKLKRDPWDDFFSVRQGLTQEARRSVGAEA